MSFWLYFTIFAILLIAGSAYFFIQETESICRHYFSDMELRIWNSGPTKCVYESLPNLPYRKCTIIFEESKYHGVQELERDCTG